MDPDRPPIPPDRKAKRFQPYLDLSPARQAKKNIFQAAGADLIRKKPSSKKRDEDIKEYPTTVSGTPRRNNMRRSAKNLARKVVDDNFPELNDLYNETENLRLQIEQDLQSPKGDDGFPKYLLALALTKDLLDAGDIVMIGLVAFLTTMIFYAWNWIYIRKRIGMTRKAAFRFFAKRIAIIIAGLIPGLSLIPEATIMVLLIHKRHKKLVQFMVSAYDVIKKQEISLGSELVKSRR